MNSDNLINSIIRVMAICGVAGYTALVFPKLLFYPHDGAIPLAFITEIACFGFAYVAWKATEPKTNK